MRHKICKYCEESKPLSEFVIKRHNPKVQYGNWCRKCNPIHIQGRLKARNDVVPIPPHLQGKLKRSGGYLCIPSEPLFKILREQYPDEENLQAFVYLALGTTRQNGRKVGEWISEMKAEKIFLALDGIHLWHSEEMAESRAALDEFDQIVLEARGECVSSL